MRTVVVTGGSGFVGRRVVERLAAHPDVGRVIAVDTEGLDSAEPNIDVRVLDLGGPRSTDDPLDEVLLGADSLIHLAWTTGADQLPGPASPNLAVLRRVLAAVADGGLSSVVYLSSATVYGAWPDNQIPLSEYAPIRPNPGFGYALEKAEAERLVAEWRDQHAGVSIAVLRPAVTVGAAVPPLYRALSGTAGPSAGEAQRPMQFLHVDDLAAAVVLVWERGLDGVYNVAPDQGTAEDTARALAGGVARLALPTRVARAVATASWRLWRAGTPKEALAYASYPWVIAGDKLRSVGWTPEYTSEEALVTAVPPTPWEDLSPGRRRMAMAAAAVLGLVGAAALVAVPLRWWALRRRRHR